MTEIMGRNDGLVVVYTGNGKGKTSAAFGTLFRARGYGLKCGVIQFIKNKENTGEVKSAKELSDVSIHVMGKGLIRDKKDTSADKVAAREAFETAKSWLKEGTHDLVILDEITYTVSFGFLSESEIVDMIRERKDGVNVVVTGRNCPEAICDLADIVTEMNMVKHCFNEGVPAKKGIDF